MKQQLAEEEEMADSVKAVAEESAYTRIWFCNLINSFILAFLLSSRMVASWKIQWSTVTMQSCYNFTNGLKAFWKVGHIYIQCQLLNSVFSNLPLFGHSLKFLNCTQLYYKVPSSLNPVSLHSYNHHPLFSKRYVILLK